MDIVKKKLLYYSLRPIWQKNIKLIYFGSTINPNFLSANLDKEKPFYSFLSINDFKNIFKNQNIDENFSWNGNSFVVDNFGSISIDVVSDNYRKAIETINNI